MLFVIKLGLFIQFYVLLVGVRGDFDMVFYHVVDGKCYLLVFLEGHKLLKLQGKYSKL